ncbi:hypothetical protein VTJ83DRAFT_5256 [Remersonia thermophila]|uniref:DUF8021 domain-containing protein n=1 Tax=Remersonia thermophila TaxID=72144 RepID=A0ABR4D8H8_9PEZI
MHYRSLLALGVIGPSPASALDCTREFLKTSADSLLAALETGDPSILKPVSEALVYHQNFAETKIETGILSKGVKIDYSRHSLDTAQCATYTEVVSATGAAPYVIGTQMFFTDGAVSKIDTLVTTTGDWLFNATSTLYWTSREDWGAIPEDKHESFELLPVPTWTSSAIRASCEVGIPSGVSLTNRRYVIDETVGAVSVFLNFATLPDSHEFRVEKGKLRYVHTVTVTNTRGRSRRNIKGMQARPPQW